MRLLESTVAPGILQAMRTASAQLSRLGVRHALVGGLAVGAYGYPRATKDVDFLVDDSAFVQHAGGIVTFAPGVPIQVGGVAVDAITAENEGYLHDALATAHNSEGVPVVSAEALVCMKLAAGRRRDLADVVQLLRSSVVDTASVGRVLGEHAPQLVAELEKLILEAQQEED